MLTLSLEHKKQKVQSNDNEVRPSAVYDYMVVETNNEPQVPAVSNELLAAHPMEATPLAKYLLGTQ